MKIGMFKKLSQLFILFVLAYSCTFSSAEEQPGSSKLENLEARLDAYKDAFRSGDFTGAASLVSPNMINKVGGKENFARLVRKFTDSTIITLKPSLIEFSKPGEIVSDGNMYISVIRQTIPITTKGIDEELKDAYPMFHPTFPAMSRCTHGKPSTNSPKKHAAVIVPAYLPPVFLMSAIVLFINP